MPAWLLPSKPPSCRPSIKALWWSNSFLLRLRMSNTLTHQMKNVRMKTEIWSNVTKKKVMEKKVMKKTAAV